ncbi:MAG: hypothetical protein QXQ08_05495 [Candidatus Bathyarchaeia archaeon]
MKRVATFIVTAVAFLLCLSLAYAEAQVGVKVGDWIKYELTVNGAPPPSDMPQWVKAECIAVTGTNATFRMTMHMSNGEDHVETWTIDVATGSGNAVFQVVVPANLGTGNTVKVTGFGSVMIAGEATGTYAGASRTYVYASITKEDGQYNYRWDKQTGILLEVSVTQGSASIACKATSTNIWQSSPNLPPSLPNLSNLPIETLSISISAIAAVAIVATAVIYTRHKRS